MENNQPLVEKYFPKKWEDIKLPKRISALFSEMQKQIGYRLLLHSSPGTGKCFGKDTEVLMFDLSKKKVQDIIVGDLLMGPDSKPRKVLNTTVGNGPLIKITQNKCGSWVCNDNHILSVIYSDVWKDYKYGKLPAQDDIADICVTNNFHFKQNHRWKLFRVPLNFEEKEVSIDPYFLGFWLGDGTSRELGICLSNQDYNSVYPRLRKFTEQYNMLETISEQSGCKYIRYVKTQKYINVDGNLTQESQKNPLNTLWNKYNLFNNKHIPKDYLINSRKVRLELFAGYIDADGGGDISGGTYDVTIKQKQLADDIELLARSLGYHVTRKRKLVKKLNDKIINKEYYRLFISGDFSDLPLSIERKKYTRNSIKNPLVYGFKRENIGNGDYYGFVVDGDHRFLLADFTVTHNSSSARMFVSDTNKIETLYLSGSNDFKIDTLRSKVMQFASGFSVMQKHKVCIIDECENIRNDLQDAFKIILDQCKNVSFIFITNEVEKVNTAIRSRCTQVDFDFSGEDQKEQQINYVKFAVDICKKENIPYDNKGIKMLYTKLYPDFRHLLVALQQIKDSNLSCTEETIKSMSVSGKQNQELYVLCTDQSISPRSLYEESTKLKGRERECLQSLGEPFFEWLNDNNKTDKVLQAAVIVSKYSDSYINSINKFVTFLACITELRSIFR